MALSFPSRAPRPDSDPDRPAGPSLVEDDPIRVAAGRILASWEEEVGGWTAGRDEVAEALDRIASEIARIRSDGGSGGGSAEASARPILEHRLCEALRLEILRTATEAGGEDGLGSPEALLGALAAIEGYRGQLRSEATEELVARLAEPDAFELVVELAHDLRSPLNSILFLSEVLRSGHSGPVTEHQAKQLGLMYSATLGMISVVSDVMDLAAAHRGTGIEDPSPFSIGSVFDSVQKMVGPMAEEKGIELAFELPDYDRCMGNAGPLGRVLLNLVTNALKFTDEGSVTVSARKLGRGRIEFSVADTGRGIAPEELERLFQPFRKSPHRKGYFFSGSGLGLSIARRLLRAMESELEIDSKPNEGSRFHFHLNLPPVSAI